MNVPTLSIKAKSVILVDADNGFILYEKNADKIKGILNFAPITLSVPKNVQIRNVDVAVNLEVLTFNIESAYK